LRNSRITGESVEKKHITRNKQCNNNAEKEKKQIAREFNEAVLPVIQKLKTSSEWTDLAYYYMSIRYLTGLVDNNYSEDSNRTIGMEMMESLSIFENHYACNLIKFIDEM